MEPSDRMPTAEEIADYLADVPIGRVAEAWNLLIERAGGPRSQDGPDRLLRPDEITDLYGIDRRLIYAHAEQLGAVKLGRRTMFVPESNLLRYLNEHRVGNGSR